MNKLWHHNLSNAEIESLKKSLVPGRPIIDQLIVMYDVQMERILDEMTSDKWWVNWQTKQEVLVAELKTLKKLKKHALSLLTKD